MKKTILFLMILIISSYGCTKNDAPLNNTNVVNVKTAGTLSSLLSTQQIDTITNLTFCNGSSGMGKATLTTIILPSSVTSIGFQAFTCCFGLTSVTIPSSVTSIGGYAFCDCAGNITVDPANANYSSLNGVLFNKAQTTLIQCPISKTGSYTIPSSVTSIGVEAFYYCTGLTSITSLNPAPPILEIYYFSNFQMDGELTAIYVPASSVNAYKTASGWSDYSSIIQAIPN